MDVMPVTQFNSIPETSAVEPGRCQVMKIAIDVLKALGLILMAAGTGCLIAGFEVPAIALLVSGVASLVLRFVLGKNEEATSVSNLNPKAPPITDLREPLPAKINSIPTLAPISNLNPKAPPITDLRKALSVKINSIPTLAPIGRMEFTRRIGGATAGQIVGDALGLSTEFKTKEEATALFHGRALELNDPAFGEGWAGQFPSGSFTDDTEQATAIIRAIDQHEKHPERSLESLFAEQLVHWLHHGLDSFNGQYKSNEPKPINGCRDAGYLTRTVLSHRDFLQDPLKIALEIWATYKPASNGSVMRTSVVGTIYHRDLHDVVEKAILFASVTHADPRSISAAVMLSVAIALVVRGHDSVEEITAHSLDIARIVLRQQMEQKAAYYQGENLERLIDEYTQDLEAHINGNWGALQLGDQITMGYAYKCIGAAFCALRRVAELQAQNAEEPFRTVIQEIVEEGGDADTNAAAAGALIGAYLKYPSIPKSWVDGFNPNADAVFTENDLLVMDLSKKVLTQEERRKRMIQLLTEDY